MLIACPGSRRQRKASGKRFVFCWHKKKDREALDRWEQYKGEYHSRSRSTEKSRPKHYLGDKENRFCNFLRPRPAPDLCQLCGRRPDCGPEKRAYSSSWVKVAKNDLENEFRLFAETMRYARFQPY